MPQPHPTARTYSHRVVDADLVQPAPPGDPRRFLLADVDWRPWVEASTWNQCAGRGDTARAQRLYFGFDLACDGTVTVSWCTTDGHVGLLT